MKKQYEECRLEIVYFASDDVITTSGDNFGGWKDTWNDNVFEDVYQEAGK